MRAPHRDRRGPCVTLLCLALVSLLAAAFVVPVLGLSIEYRVLPNGTAYDGIVQVEKSTGYQFYETGAMGERLPVKVTNISLSGACSPCTYNLSGDSGISYPEGNYTISYQGPVRENHIITSFERPYNVSVVLPWGLDVRNQFLGVVSPGGDITAINNTSVNVNWTGVRSVELRFYDQGRESLLYMFANFWLIIAFVLLTPFLLSMKRKQK
ncbi:MAG: DUF5803 family protein [Methanomicrobiales archaeon]|nr:DUF5803 family protein [Methanomicrobiales archaeon]